MKMEYLKEFYTLAEFLNFTNAAEKLYITQPALSRHITSMEEELGVTLLKRTTKSVELTKAGAMLHDALPPIMTEYDNIISQIRDLDKKQKKELRLGLPAVPVNDYLSDIPTLFQAECPGTELSYHFGEPEDNINRLIHGELDVIMTAHIPFPNMELVRFTDYYSEPMIVMFNAEDPLSQKEVVHLTDLKDYTFVVNDSAYYHVIWEKFVSECKWAGFTPKETITVKQMGNVLAHIRQGRGITVVGGHHSALATHKLAYKPIAERSCNRMLSLACRASDTNPMVDRFIEIFIQHVKASAIPFEGEYVQTMKNE